MVNSECKHNINIEKELALIKKWFDYNRISLNETKTKSMIFSGNRNVKNTKLYLNGVEIEFMKLHF